MKGWPEVLGLVLAVGVFALLAVSLIGGGPVVIGWLELVALALALVFAFWSGRLARSRNRSVAGWFLVGLFFGPVGLLAAWKASDGLVRIVAVLLVVLVLAWVFGDPGLFGCLVVLASLVAFVVLVGVLVVRLVGSGRDAPRR